MKNQTNISVDNYGSELANSGLYVIYSMPETWSKGIVMRDLFRCLHVDIVCSKLTVSFSKHERNFFLRKESSGGFSRIVSLTSCSSTNDLKKEVNSICEKNFDRSLISTNVVHFRSTAPVKWNDISIGDYSIVYNPIKNGNGTLLSRVRKTHLVL